MRRKLWSLTQLRWFVLTRDADAHGNRYLWGGRPALPETADYHQHEMLRYPWLLAMTHPVLECVHLGQRWRGRGWSEADCDGTGNAPRYFEFVSQDVGSVSCELGLKFGGRNDTLDGAHGSRSWRFQYFLSVCRFIQWRFGARVN